MHYSSWTRKSVKISEREEFVQDLPPVPRVANPNWMTVFRSNTAEAGSDSTLQSFVADLMRPLQISQPVELRRIRSVVQVRCVGEREGAPSSPRLTLAAVAQAHLLYQKLLVEDAHAEFPTAMIGFRRTTEEEVALLQNAMEALRVRFEVRLQELIGPQWQTFSVRLQKVVNQWMEVRSSGGTEQGNDCSCPVGSSSSVTHEPRSPRAPAHPPPSWNRTRCSTRNC